MSAHGESHSDYLARFDEAQAPLSLEDCGIYPAGRHMLSVGYVASALDVSPRTIQREIEDGNLRAVLIRGTWKIPVAELRRYILCQQAGRFHEDTTPKS